MEHLIREYGYLAIVVVTFFEGETIVIVAGIAASLGQLQLTGIVAAALLGSITGDQTWYYVGRRWGCQLIARRASWRRRANRVFTHLQQHQTWLILTFRFYYGLRTVTPFAIGAAGVARLRYLILNVAGAVIWALTFTLAGYAIGQAGTHAVDSCGRYVLAGASALLVLFSAITWALIRRRRIVQQR